jgi:hypothetical protein
VVTINAWLQIFMQARLSPSSSVFQPAVFTIRWRGFTPVISDGFYLEIQQWWFRISREPGAS